MVHSMPSGETMSPSSRPVPAMEPLSVGGGAPGSGFAGDVSGESLEWGLAMVTLILPEGL